MKIQITTAVLLFGTELVSTVFAQSFSNLAFEDANVPSLPAGQSGEPVQSINGIPGWTPYLDTSPQQSVLHNSVPLSPAFVAILGPNFGYGILEGNYGVLLASGVDAQDTSLYISASIGQTALIPASARSLSFRMAASDLNSTAVSFAGHSLLAFPVSVAPNYTLFAADVSALANSAGELRFTVSPTPNHPFNAMSLDSIAFSSTPIPEPGILAFGTLGALVLAFRLARKHE